MTKKPPVQLKPEYHDEFIETYADFYPIVYSAVYTRIGDVHIAEELCQEIFIIYYNKIETVRNKRTWFLGTIRNVLMNYYTKKKTANFDPAKEIDDYGLTYVNGFKEARILIKEAIDNIECGEIERALLDLISIHNFSYNEAGKILGISKSKVRYRYNRVVDRLLRYLKFKGIKELEDLL